MILAPAPNDIRPALSLRVGVTGTRSMSAPQEAHVRDEIAAVLRLVRDISADLAKASAAVALYKGQEGAAAVTLQIISPLAEGADRLVAAEGRKLDYSLVTPLPFAEDEYEKDFPDTVDAFRALLAGSTIMEIDGARGSNETMSYEAVGHFVAQNSDLLIAVWDGEATGKRGGTAEIARYAAETGVPIWWIQLEPGTSARWLGDEVQWSDRKQASLEAAQSSLEAYLATIILPPISASGDEDNLIGRMAHHIRRLGGVGNDPLTVFLREKLSSGRKPWPWRSYAWAYGRISPRIRVDDPREVPPRPAEHYWDKWFQRADQLSIDYADRYRSSYLLIIFFAFFIDFVAKIGVELSDRAEIPTTTSELLLLLVIALLVLLNHVGVWHERWINYRLLAELCRGQAILSPLGEKLPRPEITRGAALNATPEPEAVSREVWVAWFVEAVSRAAPWPERANVDAKRDALGLGLNLTIGQAGYHRQRSKRSEVADRRLGQAGEYCFFGTVVLIALRLLVLVVLPEAHHLAEVVEKTATSMSAASAAFIAIRFYSEFGMLDRQSQRMERNMDDAERELASIQIEQPLSSVLLGRSLQGLSMSMLQDIGGWAELFRIRAVEAG